jgi:hypothetical protein
MRATSILHKILRPVTSRIDRRNVRNLFLAVEALLIGRRLTLMELARHFPGAERIGAPLKRFDRLLSNGCVQAQRTAFYQSAARWLLHMPQPVLLVDWSELKRDGRWHLLRVSVVARGRAMTVYEEVHPMRLLGNPGVEAAFLRRLQAVLPKGVRPIVVTGAGFRVPWFRAVQELGWHWVGRVRHRSRVRFSPDAQWIASRELYAQATRRAVSLGEVDLTESKCFACCLALVRRAARGRMHRTRLGLPAKGGYSRKVAQRESEPWLLAYSRSLFELSAVQIAALYDKRMQIELSFRDLKSHRFGAAFEDTLTRDAPRLEMLLLIHTLAILAAWLEGVAITSETLGLPASAARENKKHSVVWLGWESLRRRHGVLSPPAPDAVRHLRELLANAA